MTRCSEPLGINLTTKEPSFRLQSTQNIFTPPCTADGPFTVPPLNDKWARIWLKGLHRKYAYTSTSTIPYTWQS
ncbi:hypothetical protein P691DRAFT_804702 [Macrolepiota fuliginosa MF-IS2]|uniref:Uncharacterized protein n=1 Tax=Macrolepiota fuliginosa MF-IS2 TaxID=1400762 RepID=A0A9P5X762_9AGAR|nr:hypothetical protein P691DRAFT_804702 [Macrolepiota fuliginosa MF-IS2]